MKLLRLTLMLLFLLFPSRALAQEEVITRFTSSITLNQNTSATITETIDYNTSLQKHGIYRYIPLKYTRGNHIFTVIIDNIKVTNGGETRYPFTQYKEKNNLVLKIGDPNSTFTGKKTYVITYTVTNALNRFDTHDEFYWDITGEGWQFTILESSALIDTRFATASESICYSGAFGSTDNLCHINPTVAGIMVEYKEPIRYGDNLTVAIKYPHPNSFVFPTPLQKWLKILQDNAAFLLIPLPLIIIFIVWYRFGRDYTFLSDNVFDHDPSKKVRQKSLLEQFRTPFVYEPLKNLTPGEAGAILDEKVDNQDVVSEIIELARLKYLKIEPLKKTGLLGSTDYQFTLLKPPGSHLKAHQSYLLKSIFGSASEKRLSALKGSFAEKMAKTKSLIDSSLTENKLYTRNPTTSRALGIGLTLLLNFITAKIVFPQAIFLGVSWPYLVFALQAVLSLILGLNLVQKTATGSNYHMQAKGLRRTIKDGKWREVIKEKNLFIEEVLPFAISFGVINQLARDMKGLNLQTPAYASSFYHSGSTSNFSQSLNSFASSTSSTLSYNPQSSSSSGGSGFSGGSSGGGGGGGGGGSW